MVSLTRLFNEFYNSEKSGGLILVFVTILSLGLANSSIQTQYLSFWHTSLGGHDLVHWINDGLMTIFFLLIGLELEREIYQGELSDLRSASLPIFAALGVIGFTMSIFITLLAFEDPDIVNNSKIAILVASMVSGITGYVWLIRALKES
jgi:Na+:H+ antiporter, NhaA family